MRRGTLFLSTRKATLLPSTLPAARSPVTATSTSRSTTPRRPSAEILTLTPPRPVKASLSRSAISASCRRSRPTPPISACAASSASPVFRLTSSTSSNSASTFPSTPGTRQSNSNLSNSVNGAMFNRNTWVGFASPEFRRHQDRQDDRALRNLHRRLQSVRGRDRRHACHHGQHRRRQPRRVRLTARPLDLVRIADDRRLPVQFAVLAGSEPQRTNDNVAAGESDCTGGNDPPAAGSRRPHVTTARSATPSVPI